MISIIIPTLNRLEYLATTIESIITQNISSGLFEMIVVNNGSCPTVKEIVEEKMKQFVFGNIRYIYEPEPGLLAARHRGVFEAEGDMLVFVDDDIIADKNWLQAIYQAFQDPIVQLVGGRNLPRYEIEPPLWLEYFWKKHPFGKYMGELSLLDFGDEDHEIDARFIWGLNFSIRKKAFFKLKGFHPDSVPEELQYLQGDGEIGLSIKSEKAGFKAIYAAKALVFHQVPKERMTPKYFDKRYFFQGVSDSYTEIRRLHLECELYRSIERLKGLFRSCKTKITQVMKMPKEKNELVKRFKKAYEAGYQFHRNAAEDSQRVLDWVLKEDYLDYRSPILKK